MLPLAILLILLITGICILIAGKIKFAQAGVLLALGIGFVLAVAMGIGALSGDVIAWSYGTAPWTIALAVGPLEALMACIFAGVGLLVMWASFSMIPHDVEDAKIPLYYALICFLIAFLSGVVFFENLLNVFILIELSSFAAAGIVIIKNRPENVRAGLKYLTLSLLGSGLVLMGLVILYTQSGSMEYGGILAGLAAQGGGSEPALLYALLFITIGVGFKSALFPFHFWLPDAHATAPSPSSAVLSGLVLKAFIVFYIKTLYKGIGYANLQSPGIQALLQAVLILGVLSMLYGSVLALLQTDIKRMIAYSSIAQIGYVFMSIGLGNELGLFAAFLHILAHAVAKSGLFLAAGSIIEQTGNRNLETMGGLGLRMPITMGLFTVGAFSMIGIPLFIGFTSKWNFAIAIMDRSAYWVLVILALSTLLNALYYLPVVIRAYFGEEARKLGGQRRAGEQISLERPLRQLLPMLLLAALVILLSLYNAPITSLIRAGVVGIW